MSKTHEKDVPIALDSEYTSWMGPALEMLAGGPRDAPLWPFDAVLFETVFFVFLEISFARSRHDRWRCKGDLSTRLLAQMRRFDY